MSARGNERGRRLRAGPILSAPRPYTKSDRKGDGRQDRPQKPDGGLPRDRHRQVEAAVVEKDDVANADRLPRSRQGLENGVVPEQQQQEQRRVAHDARVDERKS